MGRERRQFPRYSVNNLEGFHAELCRGLGITEVGMVGIGGCGFYTSKRNPLLVTGSPVQCYFSLVGVTKKEVRVDGQVIYKRTFEGTDGTAQFFYGIQFSEKQPKDFTKIIRMLEELEKSGKIQIAL